MCINFTMCDKSKRHVYLFIHDYLPGKRKLPKLNILVILQQILILGN